MGGEGRLYKNKEAERWVLEIHPLPLFLFWETVVGREKREKEKNVLPPKGITESLALLLIPCV